MAKRFPVVYPMPFGQEQYRKYLSFASEPIEVEEYLRVCWENILPDNPRVCSKHRSENFEEPIPTCLECTRYDKSTIAKTIENLVRCGFIEKNKGYVCKKHNRKKKGKRPKPVDGCPDCKPFKGKICDYHLDIGEDDPVSGCPNCSQGYVWLESSSSGKKWLKGNPSYDFPQLVYDNIKRSWGYQLRVPNGLEAIEDILGAFSSAQVKGVSGKYLYDSLSEIVEQSDRNTRNTRVVERRKGGYDFNVAAGGSRRSLREILKLLVYMGALKKSEKDQYERGNKYSSRRYGLRKADLMYEVEQIMKYIGHNERILETESDDIRLKALVSKYYIYRQTRGIGKDYWFLKSIHKMMFRTIPKGVEIKDSTGRREAIQENKILNKRSALKSKVREKWNLSEDSLANVRSLKTLMEIESATDLKEVDRILEANSPKFDKSSLDIFCHTNVPYTLPAGFVPFKWQSEALEKWEDGHGTVEHRPFNGIISVVTGAGKTVMAILGIKRYLEANPDSRISIIVPTKVLMYQWAKELSKYLAIHSSEIGFRGDGFKDSFDSSAIKIQVVIVNSAIQSGFLLHEIRRLDPNTKHLLVADECHRYTGGKFQKIFECRYEAALGLSATPLERDLGKDISSDDGGLDSVLEDKLGPVFYELSYNKALQDKLISEFTVNYVAVDLNQIEQRKYDSMTRELKDVLEKIKIRYGNRIDLMKGESLDQKLRIILNTDSEPDPAIGQYFRLVGERRDILYSAESRKGAYFYLLNDAIRNNKKIIVFHEKIEQLEEIVAPDIKRREALERKSPYLVILDNKLQSLLYDQSYRPVMYHSGHEKEFWNQWSMDWFRGDVANVMLSVKALIEGVDVPSADVGIVRVSSSSVRQRIQATGRILRRSRLGENKKSVMHVIFVQRTVDENIFKKYNWQKELGSSGIEFHHFVPSTEEETLGSMDELEVSSLPVGKRYEDNRPPIEVDVDSLHIGDLYHGRYVGDEYHVSSDGRPFARRRNGRVFIENERLRDIGILIKKLKGGGKFIISPQGNVVTTSKEGKLLFLGVVEPSSIKKEIQTKLQHDDKRGKKKTGQKPSLFDQLFDNEY